MAPTENWRSQKWPAYTALTLSCLAWSGNAIVGRAVSTDISPITLAFWRWLIAAILLILCTLQPLKDNYRVLLREWKYLLTSAVLGMALFHTFQYEALASTSAINVSILLSFSPVAVFLLSIFFRLETPTPGKIFGILVSLVGVMLVVTEGRFDRLAQFDIKAGELWMLLAIFSWSAYSILLRKKPKDLLSVPMMTAMGAISVCLLLPEYLFHVIKFGAPAIDMRFIYTIAYLSIIASVFAYLSYNFGVALVGPTIGSQFLNLSPLFTTLLSVFILGEQFQLFHLAGLVLIVSGIFLTMVRADF